MIETAPPPPPQERPLPEQLQKSRMVGMISSQEFPWLERSGPRNLDVAELTFGDGTIYMVSGGTAKMNEITSKVSEQDNHTTPDGRYTRLDQFYLQACHLEANGTSGTSRAINLVLGIDSKTFGNLTVKAWHESPKPNTRRFYFGLTRLASHQLTLAPGIEADSISEDANLLIRLGFTDKKHQVSFLRQLTKQSHQRLRAGNVGSV